VAVSMEYYLFASDVYEALSKSNCWAHKSNPLHAFNFSIFMQIIRNNFLALNQNKVLNKQWVFREGGRVIGIESRVFFVRDPSPFPLLISSTSISWIQRQSKYAARAARTFPVKTLAANCWRKRKPGKKVAKGNGKLGEIFVLPCSLWALSMTSDLLSRALVWHFEVLPSSFVGLCHQATAASSSAV